MNRTMTSKFAQSSNTNLAQTLFRTTSHTTAEVKNSGLGATVSSQLLYRGDRNWDCDGAESPIPSGHHPPSSRSQNLVQKRACARGHRLKTIKGRGGGERVQAACLGPPHASPRRLRTAPPAEAVASSAPSSPATDSAHAQVLVLAQTPPFAQRLPLPHPAKSARAAARAQRSPAKINSFKVRNFPFLPGV